MKSILLKLLFISLFLAPALGYSQQQCRSLFPLLAIDYLAPLQKRQPFLFWTKIGFENQNRFDHLIDDCGGGSCATVTAANLLQGLRMMTEEKNQLRLTGVIREAYRKKPWLLGGRVSNSQMVDLLYSFQPYLKKNISVHVDTIIEKESIDPAATWNVHQRLDESFVESNPNQMKIIVFRYLDDGQIYGRHFVILKDHPKSGRVVTIDPNKPRGDYSYDLRQYDLGDRNAQTILVRPGNEIVPGRLKILETIFTITMQ